MKRRPFLTRHCININSGYLLIIPLFLLLFMVDPSLPAQTHMSNYSSDPAEIGTKPVFEAGTELKDPVAAFTLCEKIMGTAAVTNPMIDSEESDTFELGCQFTVPFPITITELGLYDIGADGITDPTLVTLWNTTGQAPLISAVIPAGTEADLINGFRYVDVQDTRLQAGTYVMSAYVRGEGYGMNSGITAVTGEGITLNAGVYSLEHEYPSNQNFSYGFFGANFFYVPEKSAVINLGTIEDFVDSWEIGCAFTVNSPILLTNLGTYDMDDDGLRAETPVTIWRQSDQSVVVTTNIPADNTLPIINHFRYVPVGPVYLEPGQYRMSSYFENDAFAYNSLGDVVSSTEISITAGVYASTHGYPINDYSERYFGPNFLFTVPLAGVNNPNVTNSNTGSYELGIEFQVFDPITITELGSFDRYNDGLNVETIVTLWNTSDYSVILSDTIPSGTTAPLLNGFRYVDIPDYRLDPGLYRISSYFTSGEYGWTSVSGSIPEISLIRGVYSLTHGYPATNGGSFYYGPNFLIRPSCAVADMPVIDGSHLLCPGDSTLLTIASGQLNNSSEWQWYSSGCGGTMRGNNDSLLVKPSVTTTYFLQGVGNCIDNGPCGEFIVEVHDTVLVTRDHQTLTANIAGAEYQWVDCENGYAPVAGATGQSFTPETEGYYAVMVTLGDCILESDCKYINVVGTPDDITEQGIKVYPNPVRDLIEIDLPEVSGPFIVEIITMQAQKIISGTYNATPHLQISLTDIDPGMYFISIKNSERIIVTKIFKE